ncbi:hypothetical protein ACHQM5_003709 [Ranunculus cassubicifolius]
MSANIYEDTCTQKIAVSDQNQSNLETSNVSDSFIVDIENLSPRTIKDNNSANSRISVKLQRNLSRKPSQRERNKIGLPSNGDTSDISTATKIAGTCDTDKLISSPVASSGTKDSITITTERCNSRKYSKQRTSFLDPKRVLLFFATLSSMGTMVLIYMTLSLAKFSGDTAD